ncbi:WxL domain-containing protein [Enterococcus sp. BWR-S5]|uniref:WxL domain-containing protein n=1 Tax=Enterococcus sp. BWR-S5 TaxID=2787714 RepID=UPI001922EA73|nr:WxL domain-containing protein [Enterococcus sp. BWR-S5]MBL1225820.1 WxL domain-containing protein [Enterococcus sp. BWR-S5]
MKSSYKFASAALLAALGLGLAVASETKAYTQDEKGTGKIEFTQSIDSNDPNELSLPPDTTEPYITLTEPDVIPGTEELQLRVITSMDFDKHNLVATDTAAKTWPVKAYSAEKLDGSGNFEMPHFVRFRDYRAEDGKENNYKISAAMTSQFKNGSTVLGGTLNYKNTKLTTTTNQQTLPSQAVVQSGGVFSLNPEGDSVDVLIQNENGKGFGLFDLMFGEYSEITADGTTDAVTLSVPANTKIVKGTYTAEITWTLSDTI